MTTNPFVNIEENKRLSESCVWQFQRDYYKNEGPMAFARQVPFYVTCNPVIANAYVQVIVGFIRDWRQLHPETKDEPFYVLELGGGSGRFSFYAIRQLCDMLKEMKLQDVKLRYVMSDLSTNNIEFWKSHPGFQSYVEAGVLDFVFLDTEKENDVRLSSKDIDMTNFKLRNPLVVIANYLLDSIPQDCFYYDSRGMHEALVTARTSQDNVSNGCFRDFEKVELRYANKLIGDNYYGDEDFDSIIRGYKNFVNDRTLTFPIVALRLLKKLMSFCDNKMILIGADKSYCSMEDLQSANFPQLIFHGSFSMMVNMHAIGEFFARYQGGTFFQSNRKGLKTGFCYSGFELDDLPEMKRAAKEWLESFAPADFYLIQRQTCDAFEGMTYDSLVGVLALSRWDPHVLKSINKHLCEKASTADVVTVHYLRDHVDHIANNFYFMPNARDTLFDIAIFLHTIKEWKRAIPYYQKSQQFFGEQYSSSYNLGLCYFECGDLREAMCHFQKALTFKADAREAREWLEYVEKLRAESMTA